MNACMKVINQAGSQCSVVTLKQYGEPFLFGQVDIQIPGYLVISQKGDWVLATPDDGYETSEAYLVKHGTPSTWHLHRIICERRVTIVQVDMENPVIVLKEGHDGK